jgi:chromosome segregation ATPase
LHDEISFLTEALRKEIEERQTFVNSASASQESLTASIENVRSSIAQSFSSLSEEIAALKNESGKEQEALLKQRESHDAGLGAMEKLASELNTLRSETAENRNTFAELQNKLDSLRADTFKMIESAKTDEAIVKSAFAGRAEIEPMIKGLTEIRSSVVDLMNTMEALRGDFTRQQELTGKDRERRDAERMEAGEAMALAKTETLRLMKASSESQDIIAELSQAVETLQKDFCGLKERFRKENVQRDLERDGVNDLIYATRSEMETISKTGEILRDDLKTLTESLREDMNKIASLHNATQQSHETIMLEQSELRECIDDLRGELAALTNEQPTLRGTMEAVTRDVAALHGDAEQHARNTIIREQAELRKYIENWQGELAALTNGQSILQGAVETLTRDITVLHGDAARQNHETSINEQFEFKQYIEQLQRELATLTNAQALFYGTMETMTRDVAGLRADAARLYDSVEQERARLHARMDGNAEAAEVAWENVLSRMDAFRVQVEQRDGEIEELREKLKDMERQLKHFGGNGRESIEDAKEREKSQAEIDKYGAQRLHASAGEAYARGDFEEALRVLDVIDSAFPNNKSILYNRVECLIHLGRNNEARSLCDYLINILGHEPAGALIDKIPN